MQREELRIAVVGPGGVGGYFGALLARGGHKVTFLGRGAHLDAMRRSGLTIRSIGGDFHLKVSATDNAAEIPPCDLILFCVKSFHTREAAEEIRPLMGPRTVILSLQNGVDNEARLAALLGEERIMAGVAFIGSRIESPGVIVHTAAGSLAFGEPGGGPSERGRELLALFQGAKIEARLSENIGRLMWQKMVWNCGFNAVTALTGETAGAVLSHGETREIVRKGMEEVVRVARAMGIDLDEGLPGKTIAQTESQGEIVTSMLMDMKTGRPMEIDALNGAVCRLGRERGVEVPVNETLYALISAINRSRGITP